MIDKQEIEDKAADFEIHTSNVQRDYVFGWFLKFIYENAYLSGLLIFKGGNCLRKAYFPDTRFSGDLDFSTLTALDVNQVRQEINNVCAQAQDACGVEFELHRNTLEESHAIDRQRTSYKGRVYFKDFYGKRSTIVISIRLDITEFDKLYLDPVACELIHPYSDADECTAQLNCVALEELMANKLKCLIQRRHALDLYDFIYAMVFNAAEGLRRDLVVTTFLKKTIFEQSPGAAKGILLGIPIAVFAGAWEKYIICPIQSRIDFERVQQTFAEAIEQLFAAFGFGGAVDAFVPAEFRNPIMEAGREQKLLMVTYDNVARQVEPYSLAYKRRQDGEAFEYFYVYDRTGGESGPGIKAFLPYKIQNVEKTDIDFEPRVEIELSKAGEQARKGYFSGSEFSGGRRSGFRVRQPSRPRRTSAFGVQHAIRCPICGKQFKRKTSSTRLNKHKNQFGQQCSGRTGYRVF